MTRVLRILALACVLILLLGTLPRYAHAQNGPGSRYDNPALGLAFDLPAGWEVVEADGKLIAALPADLAAVQAATAPQGLAVRIVIGSFNELGIVDASQLPDLLARLFPSGVTPPTPEPALWGNGSGYQGQVTLPDGLTTRIGLLAVAGGRIAVVRGLAPSAVWESGAGAAFEALVQSLVFSLPQREEDYLQLITSNDGGVLWHFQSPQPDSGRVVIAGGITYDMFDVMYMAVGPGGVLALEMPTGAPISYMGPWYDGNFIDVAIGPDTKLYMANIADDTLNAVMVVDRAGNWTRGWGVRGDGEGEFAPGMPRTIAVTPAGEVWTISEGHASGIRNRLYHFDAFGTLLQTIDLAAINPDLSGVRLDNNVQTGALYLVGATGNLNVVDANGQPLVVNLAAEVLTGTTPVDIAIAPNDNLIIALAAPGLDGFGLLELGPAGQLVDVFGFPWDNTRGGAFVAGEYIRPGGLVVGPDGVIYWTETNPETGFVQVQAFTFTGDGRIPLGVPIESGPLVDEAQALQAADPAKGGGPLEYGQVVRGSLNNRYPSHAWTFNGRTGDHIVITMTDASGAGLLDPKIVLRRADGLEIAANDDVGDVRPDGMGERDARLDFFLPDEGTYTIEAGRFGGRGEYVLTLELVGP